MISLKGVGERAGKPLSVHKNRRVYRGESLDGDGSYFTGSSSSSQYPIARNNSLSSDSESSLASVVSTSELANYLQNLSACPVIDPESGEVICVAVVLVKATIVTKKVAASTSNHPYPSYSISSLHRHQYQASFKFSWNIDSAQCAVIDSEPLKEIGSYGEGQGGGVWHPAKNVAASLQKSWCDPQSSGVTCFTNDAVIRGTSLKTIVDSEHLVAIIQDNLD